MDNKWEHMEWKPPIFFNILKGKIMNTIDFIGASAVGRTFLRIYQLHLLHPREFETAANTTLGQRGNPWKISNASQRHGTKISSENRQDFQASMKILLYLGDLQSLLKTYIMNQILKIYFSSCSTKTY